MADERFSLRDSELDLPRVDGGREGGVEEGERISASWIAAKQRLDPTPRDEIARVFFRDGLRARLRLH